MKLREGGKEKSMMAVFEQEHHDIIFCRLDHDDKYAHQEFGYGLPGIFVGRLAFLDWVFIEHYPNDTMIF
jgi:hypothetical protein